MAMIDPTHPIAQLLSEDPRYKLEAYAFVFEALSYAQSELGMGKSRDKSSGGEERDIGDEDERHLTGQQLCEAIRGFAQSAVEETSSRRPTKHVFREEMIEII